MHHIPRALANARPAGPPPTMTMSASSAFEVEAQSERSLRRQRRCRDEEAARSLEVRDNMTFWAMNQTVRHLTFSLDSFRAHSARLLPSFAAMASRTNKLAFLSMPAPASYVAGLGRGCVHITVWNYDASTYFISELLALQHDPILVQLGRVLQLKLLRAFLCSLGVFYRS